MVSRGYLETEPHRTGLGPVSSAKCESWSGRGLSITVRTGYGTWQCWSLVSQRDRDSVPPHGHPRDQDLHTQYASLREQVTCRCSAVPRVLSEVCHASPQCRPGGVSPLSPADLADPIRSGGQPDVATAAQAVRRLERRNGAAPGGLHAASAIHRQQILQCRVGARPPRPLRRRRAAELTGDVTAEPSAEYGSEAA